VTLPRSFVLNALGKVTLERAIADLHALVHHDASIPALEQPASPELSLPHRFEWSDERNRCALAR